MPYLLYILVLLSAFSKDQPSTNNHKIARGLLPVVAADAKGVVHLTYGQDSTIYYAVATKHSSQFNAPVAIDTLLQLVIGAKRGSQLAVSQRYVSITAVNRAGNVLPIRLTDKAETGPRPYESMMYRKWPKKAFMP